MTVARKIDKELAHGTSIFGQRSWPALWFKRDHGALIFRLYRSATLSMQSAFTVKAPKWPPVVQGISPEGMFNGCSMHIFTPGLTLWPHRNQGAHYWLIEGCLYSTFL